jgi:alpha-amylase/alpha-mannosidase (GH57 family)
MADLALAILWHQHQPYYPDDVVGDNPMPWVRLHGVKDYYGMALHLLEFPEMRCTINLVPSLLLQIQGYTERGATDRPLQASRVPADGLSEEDCLYLLDTFFMANPDHMIKPFARYYELYQRRAAGRQSAREALRRFQERDFRDLQVWFNLAWVHPLAFERDAGLRELLRKGRHFTEAEKNVLLDKHLDILREIIPLHKKLAESGQVELTTTPFYHPILPLLLDKKLAREAMPAVKLPRYTAGYPEDAAVHVRRAVEAHERVFGRRPAGVWPAEGSVCQPMLPLLARHGLRWIATDEGILSMATQGFISRDAQGHVRNPAQLYRPYKVREGDSELGIVFRDHALSDMIGFHYQRSEPLAAAEDFVRHLHNIRAAVGDEPALVSVILDGENCWEHYPGGGVPFLRALYERCTRTPGLRPVSVGAYLQEHPPRDTLPHLFAGSWINHNFAIWVGHEEDNAGWDAIHRTREYLKQRTEDCGLRIADCGLEPPTLQDRTPAAQESAIRNPQSAIGRAWEEIYIAEGSDWFWWYGDEHSSAQDALFDYLFRKHLQNVYLLLGDKPPPELARPISRRGQRAVHTLPRSFLDVKIDGRETFFEWVSAGRYTSQNERGTMAMVARGPVREVYFGFDLTRLLVRVDFDRPARVALADYDALRVGFLEPAGWEVVIERPAAPGAKAELRRQAGGMGPMEPAAPVEAGIDRIVELAVPFDLLGVRVDQPVQFYVEILEGGQSRDRAPREGAIYLTRPSPDFELIMWDV